MAGFVVMYSTRAVPVRAMPNPVVPFVIAVAHEDVTDHAGDPAIVIRDIQDHREVPGTHVGVSDLVRHLDREDTPGARERIRPNAVVEVGSRFRRSVAEVP